MFDLTAFTNGFGVVLVPFVVGIVIRSILSALNAGSTRYNVMIVFIVFVFPVSSFAGDVTGSIDSILQNNDTLYVTIDSSNYSSSNDHIIDLLKIAYYQSNDISINYNDLDNVINFASVNTFSSLDSKNFSLFLGGMSCMAFILGISLKI